MLKRKPANGFTLLGFFFMLASVSTSAWLMSQIFSRAVQESKSIEIRNDREYLRQIIRRQVSCTHTLNQAACSIANQKQSINLIDRGEDPIKKVGNWLIHASCYTDTLTATKILEVLAQKLGGMSKLIIPAYLGKNSASSDLFVDSVGLCEKDASDDTKLICHNLGGTWIDVDGNCEFRNQGLELRPFANADFATPNGTVAEINANGRMAVLQCALASSDSFGKTLKTCDPNRVLSKYGSCEWRTSSKGTGWHFVSSSGVKACLLGVYIDRDLI